MPERRNRQHGVANDGHNDRPRYRPDGPIVDIKMPPTHTDEGLVAAQEMVPFGGFWAAEGQQTLEIEPTQSSTNQPPEPAEPHQ